MVKATEWKATTPKDTEPDRSKSYDSVYGLKPAASVPKKKWNSSKAAWEDAE